MTESPLVQRANKITGWLLVGFVVTFAGAALVKNLAPHIAVSAGGYPLGMPQRTPCACGGSMVLTPDDSPAQNLIYRCDKCEMERPVPR